jgi:hypothetical protein
MPRGVAGRDQAVLPEGRLHLGERLHRGVGAHVLVGVEQHHALARLDLDRNDLLLEAARGDGGRGTLLAGHGQRVLLFARDAVARGHVLGRDAHVDLLPRVVEDAEHVVDQLHVAHARAVARGGVEVRAAAHRLGAAADRDVAVAERDRLRRRDDGLQARAAEAIDVEGRRLDRAAGIDGGDAAQVGVLGVGGDHVAHHHVADGRGRDAAALDRGLDRGGGQLGVGHVLQRTAEGADGRAGAADDEDLA